MKYLKHDPFCIALSATETNTAIHNNLASHLMDQNRIPEALVEARAAVRDDPGYVNARNTLGLALAKNGMYKEALPHLMIVDGAPPGKRPLSVGYDLALVLGCLGRPREALEKLDQALSLDPARGGTKPGQVAHILQVIGRDYAFQKSYLDARLCLERAVVEGPGIGDAHLLLGRVCLQLGDFSAAYEHTKAATRLQPENADAFHYMGVACLRLGRSEEAARCFGEALRINPAHPAARELLGRIHPNSR